jgi:riboflavin kinase/FMN adenylyltransferase
VNPAAAPKLLTLPDEKRALLAQTDLDRLEVLPFTHELSQLEPEAFVRDILLGRFGMRELVLGFDHGFGRGRSGDVALLQRLGALDGFAVDMVDAVLDGGHAISSTLIRTAVAHGNFAAAARWLGRPYALRGTVERGVGRGRTIGVPTANLAAPHPRKLLPPDGVYAVRVAWRDRRYGGMMNQGSRPTFGLEARVLEVHLFDFTGDLYGETVTVEWVRRLRDVQAFPSREALVAQLGRDREAAYATLERVEES